MVIWPSHYVETPPGGGARLESCWAVQEAEAQLSEIAKRVEESEQREMKGMAQHINKGLDKISALRTKLVDAMKEKEKVFKSDMTELWAQYQQTNAKQAAFEKVRVAQNTAGSVQLLSLKRHLRKHVEWRRKSSKTYHLDK